MPTPQFSDHYKKLNPAQKEAVDSIEGPVMVVAGPGTGKTQILTLRIANILAKTQVNPENILALTFSESASLQMRSRLTEIIGTPSFRVEIATFHSFCNSIIQNYPEEFDNLLSSENILEDEQIELIEEIITKEDLKILKPWGEPLFYVKDALAAINDLKKENISPLKFAQGLKKQRLDFKKIADLYHDKGRYKGEMKGKYQDQLKSIQKNQEFIKIFSSYQNKLAESKKYDFNDMLVEVIKVLEKNHNLLLRLQEKYQYILVDEHQDTNASQNRLIELLASFYEIPNLFVVGDEKQAIFRFQGASLENFLYFQKKYPQAKLVYLEKNYRSHQLILDVSTSFIANNISANILSQTKLTASKKDKAEEIKLAILDDYFGEFEFIAQKIKQLIDSGVRPKEIAVLSRRNFDLLELMDFLKRHEIDYFIDADLDILSDIWVAKLLLILDAIENFGLDSKFARVLQIDIFKLDPIDVFRLINFAKNEGVNLFEVFENLDPKLAKKINIKNLKQLQSFYFNFKNWVSLKNNLALDDLIITILNDSGIIAQVLKLANREEVINKLISLYEEIKVSLYKNPGYNLGQFLRRIELLKKHNITLQTKAKLSEIDGVKLLTVHKAKGLEFEYVFIIQVFDGRWGNARKKGARIKIPWEYFGENIKTEARFEEIEDERRLFYVGLTRAKKDVFLSYSRFSVEGKEQLPSLFLLELKPELIKTLDTEKFNQQFLLKKDLLFEKKELSLEPEIEFDYFKKIFLEKGLSITAIENFLTCPWKYFFVNLISLPEIKNKFQMFGIGIHLSIDSLIKRRKIERNPQKFLLQSFIKYLNRQFLTKNQKQEFLEKGKIALGSFYNNFFLRFADSIQSEVIIKGVKISDKLFLNGRIDMIEEISKSQFLIHDFKTGKPNKQTDYLKQLLFYKILLERTRPGILVSEGAVDFIEPDQKGKVKSQPFDLKKEEAEQFLKEVEIIGEQIYSLNFWNSFCGEKDCQWCRLRQMMG